MKPRRLLPNTVWRSSRRRAAVLIHRRSLASVAAPVVSSRGRRSLRSAAPRRVVRHARRSTMDQEEASMLEALDRAVRSEAVRPKIDAIVARVEQKLRDRPDDMLGWEPIPLDCYTAPLPATIRSSWVFILRANTTTGAERHPNSHQRMMSYRGSGDFQ